MWIKMTKKRDRATKHAKEGTESPEKKMRLMKNVSNQNVNNGEENQELQSHPQTSAHVDVRSKMLKEKLKIKINSTRNLKLQRKSKKTKDVGKQTNSAQFKGGVETGDHVSSTESDSTSSTASTTNNNIKSVTLINKVTDESSIDTESNVMKLSINGNQSSSEHLVLINEKEENLDMLLVELEGNTPIMVPSNDIISFFDGTEDYVVLPTELSAKDSDLENMNNIIQQVEIPTVESIVVQNIENLDMENKNLESIESNTIEIEELNSPQNQDIESENHHDTENEENQNLQNIIIDINKINHNEQNKSKDDSSPKIITNNILMRVAKKLKSKKAKKIKVITKTKTLRNIGKSKHQIKKSAITQVPLFPLNQYVNKDGTQICKMCEQQIDGDLKYYNGDPIGGFEEGAVILDSKLLLFDGDEANVSTEDTRSYNKITSYSVYCKNGHLCCFDSGLIEKDVEIYFSGYIKPIHSDDPATKDGIPGKKFGPMVWWWMTGFDIGEQPTVGLSTELGDYICMKPSVEYAPFMKSVMTKIYISKIVIEFLIYEPNASYEDLLSKLQTTPVPNDLMKNFTEDTLLHYASFICDQVITFDDTAKPKEHLIVTAPCIRRLIDLAGIRFEIESSETPRKVAQISRERQFEHKIDYREKLLRQMAEDKRENSGASELIDMLLPTHEKFLTSKIPKPGRCGVCKRCARSRCRECKACSVRNYDACYQRRCFNHEIMEENEEDVQDEMNFAEMTADDSFTLYRMSVKPLSRHAYDIAWGTQALSRDLKKTYYGSVYVDCQMISSGDFIDVRSDNAGVPPQIMKVIYMYEDNDTGCGRIHACFLWSGKYTVLGDISDRQELFFIKRCIDIDVKCIVKKVRVLERTTADLDNSMAEDQSEYSYVCQRSYDPLSGTFYDLQPNDKEACDKYGAPYRYCWVCDHNNMERMKDTPVALNKISQSKDKITYESVRYKNEEYRVGTSVYLKPKSLYFTYPMLNNAGHGHMYSKPLDEKYSEVYRKAKDEDSKPNHDVPAPFDIGYITQIFMSGDKLYLKVTKLYRPENTHKGTYLSKNADINVLFWSDQDKIVPFICVIGKCYLTHLRSIADVDKWSKQGPDRFYFSQIYKNNNDIVNINKGEYGCPIETCDAPLYIEAKLKTLNIFAGCGGLVLGLQQAGASECKWAIEPDEAAAATFKLNNSKSAVFVGTCVEMMEKITKKDFKVNNQRLPKKGNVDLLCATLPSENWRSINSVNTFKSSNITTFLVYLEYYQPPFFVLETDDVLLKRSIILKLALASFIRLGYQVAFDLMQVGNFGAPQNRYRTVIIGASCGRILPNCPKNQHVFSKSFCRGWVVIDKTMYQRRNWIESAPFKAVTVRDAILDLAALEVTQNKEVTKYSTQSISFYQRMMRHDLKKADKMTVFNHVCKDVGPLVQARISLIPTELGSDWRDLPNIEYQLRDKTFTNKLVYSYNDPELGKGEQGQPRGVCSCSVGQRCKTKDVQENTLIPWHLVHSGKRHGHWAGLYGKLQWDSIFTGTSTNPEPLAKKAPVIHPSRNRVLSVRECARAQGFPDSYILAENFPVHKMYQQIGLSTSPLLAQAIGREIVKSVVLNITQ
ncbi:DNA (cytosine-5)-methyltransferase 1-like [Phymastichus coffea]|uniref:DNA (cytosine-5)-methyltransferase 1-like n=1 Tax=Phymastichus coffea TaxID=108790 RepID=UPI00273B8915|nr:DNA (cytosine-5)-methyltransferase 1-like [Phymastichus coffea]